MVTKKAGKTPQKISSSSRLEDLLNETELELEQLEPQIEKLEKQIDKLRTLKLAKQKLITLKLSIKSILSNYSESKVDTLGETTLEKDFTQGIHAYSRFSSNLDSINFQNRALLTRMPQPARLPGTFLPDMAFNQVNEVLRKKSSLNYELFRAIVFNGGQANTDQIKQYLIEQDIRQPASGEGFESVELTDISSRVNYLYARVWSIPTGEAILFPAWAGWYKRILKPLRELNEQLTNNI